MQVIFSSIDFGFEWTEDGWYKFDAKAAQKAALAARNAKAKELRKSGRTVTIFSLGNQLMSRGGIGSGKPHIEVWANAYGINAG